MIHVTPKTTSYSFGDQNDYLLFSNHS